MDIVKHSGQEFMWLGKAKKIFVCENPGGQKNIHQAGRESIFLPNFQTILTN